MVFAQSGPDRMTLRERGLIAEIIPPDLEFELEENHSKLVRTLQPVVRASVVDPTVVEITQFDTNNIELLGLKTGTTDLTLWFGDVNAPDPNTADVLRYRVRVKPSDDIRKQRQLEYSELQDMLNELFPNSSIELILVANKLMVRGQARDGQEAYEIMSLIRRRGMNANSNAMGGNSAPVSGPDLSNPRDTGFSGVSGVINMLKVPGEQQVMLKVRVAEISRSALREIGMDFSVNTDNVSITSELGTSANLVALLSAEEVTLMLRALSDNAYTRILAEPNLVTLSGRPASFISGGQFAVPTAVGVDGIAAASTFFQGFGTQLQFTPTVLDKDRIRLRVAPTFSTLNQQNAVNGIPGLDTRSVFTTVDMREGQWFAVAGLIQEQQSGGKVRVPGIGDVPLIGNLFGRSFVKKDETELLILVSPQLVHPLESDAVPCLLPGMDISEPTNHEFYLKNRIEGTVPGLHRSTTDHTRAAVYPSHPPNSRRTARHRASQKYFLPSPHGFSE
jgi:pilus assembly protein CpaC